MSIKIVIGHKGKCLQKELSEDEGKFFIDKKLGDKVDGSDFGYNGYEFEITGGSDQCGFPMRKDVDGAVRKKILAVEGIGLKKKMKGIRQRKTVCGNTIHEKTSQINLKVLKEGSEPLFEEPKEEKPEQPEEKSGVAAEKTEEKTEEKQEEQPKESEEKPAETKEEKPEQSEENKESEKKE